MATPTATFTTTPASFEDVNKLRLYLAANVAVAEADSNYGKAETFREFVTTVNCLVAGLKNPLESRPESL
jgi:hypothetical protein